MVCVVQFIVEDSLECVGRCDVIDPKRKLMSPKGRVVMKPLAPS